MRDFITGIMFCGNHPPSKGYALRIIATGKLSRDFRLHMNMTDSSYGLMSKLKMGAQPRLPFWKAMLVQVLKKCGLSV